MRTATILLLAFGILAACQPPVSLTPARMPEVPVASPSGGRLVLAHDGKSTFAIVVAADASSAARHGAGEIQSHLARMSGATLPIFASAAEARANRRTQVITVETPGAGDPPLAEEEFRIRTTSDGIAITGGGKRGALYGCYGFLEDVLGIRWYTTRVTRIPRRATVEVGPLDIHDRPAFEYREPFYAEAFERDWAVRNRVNGDHQKLDATVGGKISYGRFVHTFNSLVPPEKYFDAHPEYFSLVGGTRMKGIYQLCLTHPDVLRIAIEQVREWIHEKPEATIFSVSQNDTRSPCECDRCQAVKNEEGAESGPLLRFVNGVADAIAAEAPHVLIDTLAYQYTEDPPKLVRPRKNVRIRLAPIDACFGHGLDQCAENRTAFANLERWSRITDQLYIWHYSTNFRHYLLPFPDLDEIARDIPLFKRHGVAGVFYEGGYARGGGSDLAELKAYLNAKLLWNPDRPAQPIIDEFLDGVFGPAAPHLKQWIDLMHAKVREGTVKVQIYDEPTAPYFSPELATAGTALFDAAEAAAGADKAVLDQVQRARLSLEYLQLSYIQPRYTVEDGKFRPVGGEGRADLIRRIGDKIKTYGITEVREREPVQRFLDRVGAPPKEHEIVTLENDRLRLDAIPTLGGRIFRLVDKKTGTNLLREPSPTDPGYPASSGYREYSDRDGAGTGSHEEYTVVPSQPAAAKPAANSPRRAPATRVQLTRKLPSGVVLARTYRLERNLVHIRTTMTNQAAESRTVTLRMHPSFAVPRTNAKVVFRTPAGELKTLTMAEQGRTNVMLTAKDLAGGVWTLEIGNQTIRLRFPQSDVERVGLRGYLSAGNLDPEVFAHPKTLAPGNTATIDTTWQIGTVKPSKGNP